MRRRWVRGLGATVAYVAALSGIAALGDDVAAATGWQLVALEVIAVSLAFGAFVGRFWAVAVPPALIVGALAVAAVAGDGGGDPGCSDPLLMALMGLGFGNVLTTFPVLLGVSSARGRGMRGAAEVSR